MKLDWKEKFPEYLTPAGNMKRNLTTEQKTEVFAYRVSDKFKVVGLYGKNAKEPVLCECVECGSIGSIIPEKAVIGTAACKTCKGTDKQKIAELENNYFELKLPEHILHGLPSYVGIRGNPRSYKGMEFLDTTSHSWRDLLYHDIVMVVRLGLSRYYSIMTCKSRFFKSMFEIYEWSRYIYREGGSCNTGAWAQADQAFWSSRKGYGEYMEIDWVGPDQYNVGNTHQHLKMTLNDDGSINTPNGFNGLWLTKKAPIVKFALELKYRHRRYYPNIGSSDEVYYLLTQEDLQEISSLAHIDDAIYMEGLEPRDEDKIRVEHNYPDVKCNKYEEEEGDEESMYLEFESEVVDAGFFIQDS